MDEPPDTPTTPEPVTVNRQEQRQEQVTDSGAQAHLHDLHVHGARLSYDHEQISRDQHLHREDGLDLAEQEQYECNAGTFFDSGGGDREDADDINEDLLLGIDDDDTPPGGPPAEDAFGDVGVDDNRSVPDESPTGPQRTLMRPQGSRSSPDDDVPAPTVSAASKTTSSKTSSAARSLILNMPKRSATFTQKLISHAAAAGGPATEEMKDDDPVLHGPLSSGSRSNASSGSGSGRRPGHNDTHPQANYDEEVRLRDVERADPEDETPPSRDLSGPEGSKVKAAFSSLFAGTPPPDSDSRNRDRQEQDEGTPPPPLPLVEGQIKSKRTQNHRDVLISHASSPTGDAESGVVLKPPPPPVRKDVPPIAAAAAGTTNKMAAAPPQETERSRCLRKELDELRQQHRGLQDALRRALQEDEEKDARFDQLSREWERKKHAIDVWLQQNGVELSDVPPLDYISGRTPTGLGSSSLFFHGDADTSLPGARIGPAQGLLGTFDSIRAFANRSVSLPTAAKSSADAPGASSSSGSKKNKNQQPLLLDFKCPVFETKPTAVRLPPETPKPPFRHSTPGHQIQRAQVVRTAGVSLSVPTAVSPITAVPDLAVLCPIKVLSASPPPSSHSHSLNPYAGASSTASHYRQVQSVPYPSPGAVVRSAAQPASRSVHYAATPSSHSLRQGRGGPRQATSDHEGTGPFAECAEPGAAPKRPPSAIFSKGIYAPHKERSKSSGSVTAGSKSSAEGADVSHQLYSGRSVTEQGQPATTSGRPPLGLGTGAKMIPVAGTNATIVSRMSLPPRPPCGAPVSQQLRVATFVSNAESPSPFHGVSPIVQNHSGFVYHNSGMLDRSGAGRNLFTAGQSRPSPSISDHRALALHTSSSSGTGSVPAAVVSLASPSLPPGFRAGSKESIETHQFPAGSSPTGMSTDQQQQQLYHNPSSGSKASTSSTGAGAAALAATEATAHISGSIRDSSTQHPPEVGVRRNSSQSRFAPPEDPAAQAAVQSGQQRVVVGREVTSTSSQHPDAVRPPRPGGAGVSAGESIRAQEIATAEALRDLTLNLRASANTVQEQLSRGSPSMANRGGRATGFGSSATATTSAGATAVAGGSPGAPRQHIGAAAKKLNAMASTRPGGARHVGGGIFDAMAELRGVTQRRASTSGGGGGDADAATSASSGQFVSLTREAPREPEEMVVEGGRGARGSSTTATAIKMDDLDALVQKIRAKIGNSSAPAATAEDKNGATAEQRFVEKFVPVMDSGASDPN